MIYLVYEETAMIHVDIEDLEPGMILERPVRNSQGVLLLQAGTRITKKSIRIFKSWGVTGVTIKGEAPPAYDPTGLPASLLMESGSIKLKERFSEVL